LNAPCSACKGNLQSHKVPYTINTHTRDHNKYNENYSTNQTIIEKTQQKQIHASVDRQSA